MLQRLKFAFQPALSRQMTGMLTASPLMDHLVALQFTFLAVIATGPDRPNETYIHLRALIMIPIDLAGEVALLIGLLALPTTADDEILHLPVTLGLMIIINLPMVDLHRQDIDRAHRMQVVEAFHRDLEVIVGAKGTPRRGKCHGSLLVLQLLLLVPLSRRPGRFQLSNMLGKSF